MSKKGNEDFFESQWLRAQRAVPYDLGLIDDFSGIPVSLRTVLAEGDWGLIGVPVSNSISRYSYPVHSGA